MPKLTPGYFFTAAGRISRSEYWLYFQLPALVVNVLMMLAGSGAIAIVLTILLLIMVIPIILAGIRRFHDRDKSGWWMLIVLIPIIGSLWIVIELGFLKGTSGPNRFGADPTSPIA